MKIYTICTGTTAITGKTYFTVQSNCDLAYSTVDTETYERTHQVRIVKTDIPMVGIYVFQPYTYWYYDDWTIRLNGVTVGHGTNLESITVPANTWEYNFQLTCKRIVESNGGHDVTITTHTYTEAIQQFTPSCSITPPTCGLQISVLQATAPTAMGGSDGSITVQYTHPSGTTCQYWLNGATDGNQYGTPHYFTGLTSGTYNIQLQAQVDDCIAQGTIVLPQGELKTSTFIVAGIGATGNTGTGVNTSGIYAVENPIILGLGTGIASINPLPSINTITLTGGTGTTISAVTVTFNLTFPSVYNAVFKSKAYPDRSTVFMETQLKNEIGVLQGYNTQEEIITSLAECLLNDSVISRLYYITNSGTQITLKSKDYGSMYDLYTGNTTIAGHGLAYSNTQSGQIAFDGQSVSDYSLYVELFVDTNLQFGATPVMTDYKRVTELELPFNETNVHNFDLSTTLKNFVVSPKIDFTMTGFTTSPLMDTTFYCKYGEKFPLIKNTPTSKKRYKGTTPVLYALNSALDYESVNDMGTYLGTPISSGSSVYSGVTFMNVAPNPKYIARGSKEYLYYLLKAQYPNALSLRGDIYFYNGTSQTGVTFFQITNITGTTNFGGVTVLAAGYDELGLSAYENSGNTKIRRIDFAVWQTPLSGASYKLTETRSYLLEIDEQPQKFNTAFLNKIGTYETYSWIGEVIEDEIIERQTFQSPYPVSAGGAANTGFIYNGVWDTKFTKVWTVNSGIVDEATYYYLMGLLQSNRIYNYGNVHENSLQVISQTAQKSSNSAEWTVQVQFKETIYENQVEK